MKIEIVRRPIGSAPDWVRDAWIGLILPTPQHASRSLRTTSVSSNRKTLFPLIGVIRGKYPHVSGFLVNGKAAVGLLAETQPAAADWWRTNAPTFLTGKEYLVFDVDCCDYLGGPPSAGDYLWSSVRVRKAFPASPGRIALLWIIATLLRIAKVVVFPGDDMYPVSSVLFLSGTSIFAAFLAAWVLRLRGSTLHLVSALVTFDLFMTVVSLAFEALAHGQSDPHWLIIGVYFLILANLIGIAFSGLRSRKRRLAAMLLVLVAKVSADALLSSDQAFWRLSAATRSWLNLNAAPDPQEKALEAIRALPADRLWGAQQGLVSKSVDSLLPRWPNRRNVYAITIAAAGSQALFAREAKLALQVAAKRFDQDYRGGVFLSNAAADILHSPFATQANMAAAIDGVSRRADPSQDTIFLYLASHGSRDAELETDLPTYDDLSPISSKSVAHALAHSGIRRRVIVISACFSGSWIPSLANDDTIVITAARADRTSFGCDDTLDLTYFGDAFLKGPLANGASLKDAFQSARTAIERREAEDKLTPSEPQVYVGTNMQGFWTAASR